MIIFATIFSVGFFVLILNLLFGGDTGIEADTQFDTHVGDGGPSIFSLRVVSLVMVGFGAAGFGARATTEWSMFQCSMAGVAGALVVGAIGWLILKAFFSSQASSAVIDSDLIGQNANIIDAIAANKSGQVSCAIRGREITFMARSFDGRAISRGTPVKIISKTGGVVTVRPLQDSTDN